MKFLLGTKDAMTQIFDEQGSAIPVTAITVTPNTVTQVKNQETDGYIAIQVAAGERNKKSITKAVAGHLSKSGKETARVIREFRVEDTANYSVGDNITVEVFEAGDMVTVSSTSKGKGFQGGVKRHGFSGGRRSHGNKHAEREVGSIGAMGPQRVFKGLRGPGRMGSDRITVKNLEVVKVDTENNRILVKGALAGKRGDVVEIVAA